MYRCQKCHAVTPPNTRCVMIVVETREKHYAATQREVTAKFKRSGPPDRHARMNPAGSGHEIIKELRVCQQCAESHRKAAG